MSLLTAAFFSGVFLPSGISFAWWSAERPDSERNVLFISLSFRAYQSPVWVVNDLADNPYPLASIPSLPNLIFILIGLIFDVIIMRLHHLGILIIFFL